MNEATIATGTTVIAQNPGGCLEVTGTLVKIENNMAHVEWTTGTGRVVVGRFTNWRAA